MEQEIHSLFKISDFNRFGLFVNGIIKLFYFDEESDFDIEEQLSIEVP